MKKIFRVVLPLSVITLVIGCSKSSSPVSVSENNSLTSAELMGDSPYSIDIATASPSIVWALSSYPAEGRSDDFYLFKYNSGTNTWANTGHWGKAHTVSPSGRNYHINTNQEIWWGDGNGNFGPISTSGQGISELLDIAVNHAYSNDDYVWVLCKTTSNTIIVKEFKFYDNSPTWLNDPEMPTLDDGYYIWKIARNPNIGGSAVLVAKHNNPYYSKRLYARDNNSTWQEQNISYRGIIDVAVCASKLVYTCSPADGAPRLVRGTINGYYADTAIDNSLSCAINSSWGNFYNVYYLSGNYKVVREEFQF